MQATATLVARPTRAVPWSRLGDEILASRAAGGSDAAFTALYQRYHGPLLGYTRSILLDPEDARDATQNALESALRALPSRESGRPLRPWLYKIAHNEAITIMRRRRPQAELSPGLEPTVPGPEADADRRGRLAQLVDDLQRLPERQRGALVMRELNGLSYDEIGSALGLTNEAARRAVFDARNSLHAAADGRATECVSVRHSISDGDRRSLRARGIRAHLRSCDDCASFQRAIGARRADLHALAPWVPGAAVMGALGGVGGGGTLLAAGGASTGGGVTWVGLPLAVKGLAVAAAVATTGTAAVEIKHVARPDRPVPQAQAAQARPSSADAIALRAAALAAGAAARGTGSAAASTPRRRVRATTAMAHSSSASTSLARPNRDTPALAPPVSSEPEPAAGAVAPPSAPAATPVTPEVVKTPTETAIAKLSPLRDQVRQTFAEAQAIAADGTQSALALASGLLDSTLGPLRASIDRVLAPLGLALPASTAAPAASTGGVLAPVQQMLSGVQSLLQQLVGRG